MTNMEVIREAADGQPSRCGGQQVVGWTCASRVVVAHRIATPRPRQASTGRRLADRGRDVKVTLSGGGCEYHGTSDHEMRASGLETLVVEVCAQGNTKLC